jgi:hypothetical protein
MLTESPEDSTNGPRLEGTGVLKCDKLSPTLPATHSRALDSSGGARPTLFLAIFAAVGGEFLIPNARPGLF